MRIADVLYGEFDITEPVILQLIDHPAMLRLKGVSQYGVPENCYPDLTAFSRFEHSVGVMLLLRKLGAPLKEQISGLLHDVSHTVFSHVIDRVYKGRVAFQDSILEDYLLISGIAEVLESYSFDYKEISSCKNFYLLEQESPELCADRVDYTLRELFSNNKEDVAMQCISELAVSNGRIVFKSKEFAKLFAHNYLDRNMAVWASPLNIRLYSILAESLSIALDERIITKQDLFTTDIEVMKKLYSSNHEKVISLLQNLRIAQNVPVEDRNPKYIGAKFRYVDPLFFEGLSVRRLSESDNDFNVVLEDCKNRFNEYYKVLIS